MGKIMDSSFKYPNEKQESLTVQCFPLYSILLATNQTKVDYLSLDVEGHEFRVLKTIPWSKIDVKVPFCVKFPLFFF